jgi:hypothetical protein
MSEGGRICSKCRKSGATFQAQIKRWNKWSGKIEVVKGFLHLACLAELHPVIDLS